MRSLPVKEENLPLYCILSGIELLKPLVEIGPGILLTQKFADIFAPPIMAYSAPEKGRHHPSPWSGLSGGIYFDCRVQLEIHSNIAAEKISNQMLAWLIAALLRLEVEAPISLAAMSDKSFVKENSSNEAGHLFEYGREQWGIFPNNSRFIILSDEDELALTLRFPRAIELWDVERFNRAFTIFDQARWSITAEAAATMIWTAIEILFGVSASLNKGRIISDRLSQFIGANSDDRNLAKGIIRDLYKKRGSVVHAGKPMLTEDFIQLFKIATVAFRLALIEELPAV